MAGSAVLCPHCETESFCSASDLYAAKKAGKKAMIVCGNCGKISETIMEELPSVGTLDLVPWSEQLSFVGGDGEKSWLPCIELKGPEGYLPGGAYAAPGDETSPRLWLYKNAKLEKSPDGTTWWKWEDYVKKHHYDPFHKLAAMRGEKWVKFMTRGQEPHIRTRVVSV